MTRLSTDYLDAWSAGWQASQQKMKGELAEEVRQCGRDLPGHAATEQAQAIGIVHGSVAGTIRYTLHGVPKIYEFTGERWTHARIRTTSWVQAMCAQYGAAFDIVSAEAHRTNSQGETG